VAERPGAQRREREAGATVGGVAIYALGDAKPEIHPDAFVHPDATVIGNVTIGSESTIWPQAVLRGDYGYIRIGARTSIQDGTVVHCTNELPTIVGDDCVVGHLAHLECCVVEDGALIGTNSVVLHRAIVRSGALVAASAFVPNGMEVPPGAVAVGVPAKLRLDAVEPGMIADLARGYVENGRRYRAEMQRLD
jgi:carbonic anhydrase/acetyltransferase-like protein (isoleucine patch superfamily)